MHTVVLKAPGGTRGIYTDSNQDSWTTTDVNIWLEGALGKLPNRLIYNDELAGEQADSYHAHAKGVLEWDDTRVQWLIHSCPNWPAAGSWALPESVQRFGQSFLLLELPAAVLPTIMDHLEIMEVHASKAISSEKKDFDVAELFVNTLHVAKSRAWNKDLFEDGIAGIMHGGMFVESWMRPPAPDTADVKNIGEIRWPDGTTYEETQDHSKYAFSSQKDNPWVYVGDINHMRSQARRGGGGAIIRGAALWSAFYSLYKA